MKVKVFVSPKEGILDPQGRAVMGAMQNLGFEGVKDVRVGKYIQIEMEDGKDIEDRVKKMSEELLHNPLIESYSFKLSEE